MLFNVLSIALAIVGAGFFVAGTVGFLRFPDVFTRLHALTKADTLGLGFIALAVALQAASVFVALKILFVWLLAMAAGATSCNQIAAHARRSGQTPWKKVQS